MIIALNNYTPSLRWSLIRKGTVTNSVSGQRLLSCGHLEMKCLLDNMARNVNVLNLDRKVLNGTYRYKIAKKKKQKLMIQPS